MEITLLFTVIAGLIVLGVILWSRTGHVPPDPIDFGPLTSEIARIGERVAAMGQRIDQFDQSARREANERDERLRREIGDLIAAMRQENRVKLDEIRGVVNEQLQKSLESRLGAAFQEVNKNLASVYAGLGEMQRLAQDVGNLNRTLTNVKTRGIFGELQLESLLEDVLTPSQYERNYRPRSSSREAVEFAVKLPGRKDGGDPVYLPIDSKFPREDYDRLVEASSRGDEESVKIASKALEERVLGCARDIRDKYIHPPQTTDFAILFVPTEGLYAEIARRTGLLERINRDCRVTVSGPSTLGMLLNALNIGFRTLAVEQRSNEIRDLLSAVSRQFHKFGEALEKVHTSLERAQSHVELSRKSASAITRKLAGAALPPSSLEASEALIPELTGEGASSDDATEEPADSDDA